MADIDNIKTVEIGSASEFRGTINDNFTKIKNNWTGTYVGSSQTEANNNLKVGGLWIVTND